MHVLFLTLLSYGLKGALCYHSPIIYTFVNQALSWHNARAYCRKHYDDLITITSLEVNEIMSEYPAVWIGLSDRVYAWKRKMTTAPNSWRWSVTESFNNGGYQNWALNQPSNTKATEYCVSMMNGQWDDVSCDASLPFVCVTGSAESYTFIATNMTWADAKNYCRQSYKDLAMILNETANSAVASVVPSTSTKVWIGLYRVPWVWSDGRAATFTNWNPGYPNNNGGQHCVRANPQTNHKWNDNDCSVQLPFFCQHVETKASHFKLKLQSSADLSDPAVYNQIMQQVAARLESMGITDFKLRWNTTTTKK